MNVRTHSKQQPVRLELNVRVVTARSEQYFKCIIAVEKIFYCNQ